MNGGKYLAHGSFGVVFSPAIDCKNDHSKRQFTNNDVGKVFTDKEEFEQELELMRLITEDFESFAIPIKSACEIKHPSSKDLGGVPKHIRVKEGLQQIVYRNGGIDLQQVVHQKFKSDEVTRLKWVLKIFRGLLPIMEGLCLMEEKDITHNDIKPLNILYDSTTGNCCLIDWGLALKTSKNYHSVGVKNAVYPYYAPDYQTSMRYSDNKKTVNVLEILHRNTSVFNKSIHVGKLYEKFGLDIEVHVKILEDHLKYLMKRDKYEVLRFYQEYANTIDLYALGITLLQILCDLKMVDSDNIKIFVIKRFIASLISIDPRLRLSPKKALSEYKGVLILL